MRVCSIDGCDRLVYARTWCHTHYVRWMKYKDVTVDHRHTRRKGEAARFWAFVDKSGDCWVWTGGCSPSGYGKFWADDGRTLRPHCWAYEQAVGPIPDGLQIDHACHSTDPTCPGGDTCLHRRCVNPDHLEAVTGLVNTRRGGNARKTHCKYGHEFTPENTYIIKPNPSTPRGGRACNECRNRLAREHQARKRAA